MARLNFHKANNKDADQTAQMQCVTEPVRYLSETLPLIHALLVGLIAMETKLLSLCFHIHDE